MESRRSTVAGWLIIILMLCQFVPLDRVNPTAITPARVPPEVRGILENQCGQCHSNSTRWPKTAYIAPLSWYVVHKVQLARQKMNLSQPGSTSGSSDLLWKKELQRLLVSADLSKHAAIPGFNRPYLTADERKTLLEWSSSPEREQPQPLKNSARNRPDRTP